MKKQLRVHTVDRYPRSDVSASVQELLMKNDDAMVDEHAFSFLLID